MAETSRRRRRNPGRVEAKASDVLANERTFLAYVRTSLSFIAFGFVIARFGLFLERFALFAHVPAGPHYSSTFGIAMAALGVAIGIFGGWRYAATDKALRAGKVDGLRPALAYVITIAIAAIGLIVGVYLSTTR
jgi:putative membrane protein